MPDRCSCYWDGVLDRELFYAEYDTCICTVPCSHLSDPTFGSYQCSYMHTCATYMQTAAGNSSSIGRSLKVGGQTLMVIMGRVRERGTLSPSQLGECCKLPHGVWGTNAFCI